MLRSGGRRFESVPAQLAICARVRAWIAPVKREFCHRKLTKRYGFLFLDSLAQRVERYGIFDSCERQVWRELPILLGYPELREPLLSFNRQPAQRIAPV